MRIEDAIKDGFQESVLFLGAGFSRGANNLNNREPFTGKQLSVELSRLCSLPNDTPLEDAAEEFQTKFGADELIKLLKKEYTISGASENHKALSKFKWQ